MVYAGELAGRSVSLGVSGRLKDHNLVMWDQESGTLWSQMTGEALHGARKGEVLDMAPAVFVSFATWKRIAPKTRVLNLTGVRTRSWYYTREDLARGSVQIRTRRGLRGLDLALGMRKGGKAMAVPFSLLHKKKLVEVTLGGVPLAVVWDEKETAPLVYERRLGKKTLKLRLEGATLRDKDGDRAWDVLTGRARRGAEAGLRRFPYIPSYLSSWIRYHPEGKVLGRS